MLFMESFVNYAGSDSEVVSGGCLMRFKYWERITRAYFLAIFLSLFTAIPSHAAPALSVYGKLPGFERATISASGDHIAIIGDMDGKRRLLVLDRASKPVKVLEIPDIKIVGLQWAGDGHLLLERWNTATLGIDFTADKAELYSVLVIPMSDEKPWSVLQKRKDVTGGIRNFYGISEREGKWYGYFSAITLDKSTLGGDYQLNTTRPMLYEVDLQDGGSKKISDRVGEDGWRSWLVGQDGKVGASLDYWTKSGNWVLHRGMLDSIAKGQNKLGDVNLVAFGSGGDTVIYNEADTDSGEGHWYEVPLAGGEAKEILADVYVHGMIRDNRSRRLIGYRLEGDRPAYHFFKPYHQKVMDAVLKAFPGISVYLVDWNDAFNRLIVETQGPSDPGTWNIIDVKSGRADILGTSYPMAGKDVGPMKMVQYKAQDGTDIEAVLTLPPGREAKKLPVVVMPHGGPSSRDYPNFDWMAQAFASRGYAVLQPNFRGSTGYGAAFERAGDGQWGRKMQTDISDGLAYMVAQGVVDPKRACIVGWSYGGYAALVGVTLQQGLYRCSVSMAGIGNVVALRNSEVRESGNNVTVSRNLKQQLGTGDLDSISPVRFADKADAPVLLIHGKDDTVVLYDQSNDMAAALRKAGKPVEFVTLPGGDHWLVNGETRLKMLEAAVGFVEKHNPPAPAP